MKKLIPLGVVVDLIRMPVAKTISFQRQACFDTIEIKVIISYWMLPAKLVAGKTPIT